MLFPGQSIMLFSRDFRICCLQVPTSCCSCGVCAYAVLSLLPHMLYYTNHIKQYNWRSQARVKVL